MADAIPDECLCKAARRGDIEMIKRLIAGKQTQRCVADLSVNLSTYRPPPQDYYPGNKDFESRAVVNTLSCLNRALHYVCYDYNTTGEVGGVRLLLDAGAEVDVKDEADETPLMRAAGENFIDIMKLLIERGANPQITAILYQPVVRQYTEAVSFLLANGVVPTSSYIYHAFSDTTIIKMILDNNPSIIKDDSGLYSGLAQMAKLWLNEPLAVLLERGANPNASDPDSPMKSLVHVAARYRNEDGMKMLLAAGAKINLQDSDTISEQGATRAATHIKNQLDALGIPSQNVVEWRSPLYIASKVGADMIPDLLKAGANVLAVTRKGRLALHAASPFSLTFHLLVSEPYNCPLDIKDLNGDTPLMMHINKEEWQFYRPPLSDEDPCIMLLQHGASYEYEHQRKSFLYQMARHQKLTPKACNVAFYSGNELQLILRDIDEVINMVQKQEDASGYTWLTNFLSKPESLKMVCVRAIRSQLRKARPGLSIWASIFQLPLPKSTIQLLTLNQFQPDVGPWKFYGSVHPNVLREYWEVHEKE